MKNFFTLLIVSLSIASCASLNSTILNDQNKHRVFVVNTKPTRCEFISNINGVGTEKFEGNTRYTVPLAMSSIKSKTINAGANVLYIDSAYKSGNSYVVNGTCYKCKTKIVRKRKTKRYRITKGY